MGVTEVVRGADLLESTPRQLYLYHLLGKTPPRFCHVPLLLTADGKAPFQAGCGRRTGHAGGSPAARGDCGDVLRILRGFNPSAGARTPEMLLADFDWERVPRADIRIPEGLFQ